MTPGGRVVALFLAFNLVMGLETAGPTTEEPLPAECEQFATADQTIDLIAVPWLEKKATLNRLQSCTYHHARVHVDGKYFKHGMTGLMAAARFGFDVIADTFCHYGADVNATDEAGNTPVKLAAKWGHSDILRVLLELGADVDAADNANYTPLYWAAQMQQADTLAILVRRGADINRVQGDDS